MENIWSTVLIIASAIVLLANAVEKIVNAVKAAKAPMNEQQDRITALEEWKVEVDRKLNRDNDRLSDIGESNRVTQRAILALLDHGIDGNNTEQMKYAKEELQNHLINKYRRYNMEMLNAYIVPVTLIVCLCVGYIIKHFIPTDKINKWIPLIVALSP